MMPFTGKGRVASVTLGLAILVGTTGMGTFSGQSSTPSPLIDGLKSYLTPEQAKSHFGPDVSWVVVEDSNMSTEKEVGPPFHRLTVSVENFSHLRFSGNLRLQFFNGRLAATIYYPSSGFDKYVAALVDTYKLRLKNVSSGDKFWIYKEARIAPYTRILVTADDEMHRKYGGRHFVTWEDIRLTEEFKLWAMKD